MRNVLYISNIEVPYRNEFFNQLSQKVNLTVIYERKKSSNRDDNWNLKTEKKYTFIYLKGLKVFNEYTVDLKLFKYIFSKKYDDIILGCFNSPSQILAILIMRVLNIKYILNLDGEYFFEGRGIKKIIKRFLLKGAYKYFVAGDKQKEKLKKYISVDKIYTYHFSSLSEAEIINNSKILNKNSNNKVLVIGQYFFYKGIDVALKVAELDSSIKYKFIGSSKRNSLLQKKVEDMNLNNVEIIPFLRKEELFKEYQTCKCLLLPSNKECWGLVINEAASFGCPIISTYGSGASMEFLEKKWIVEPGDYLSMYKAIKNLDIYKYNKQLLIKKSFKYTIENNVKEALFMLEN